MAKKDKRRDPFARSNLEGKDPIDLIPVAKKTERDRTWSKKHPTYVYLIPSILSEVAQTIKTEIKSASQYDQNGQPRLDGTTDSDMATIFIDYALTMSKRENITFFPTPKGKMTLGWEEAEAGWEPAKLPPPKPKKNKREKKHHLAYRWTAEHHAAIQLLAGDTAPSSNSRSPHRYTVPIGEVVVRLLQRALRDYKAQTMHPTFRPEIVQKEPTGWAKK
jgi:hypothetical protein